MGDGGDGRCAAGVGDGVGSGAGLSQAVASGGMVANLVVVGNTCSVMGRVAVGVGVMVGSARQPISAPTNSANSPSALIPF